MKRKNDDIGIEKRVELYRLQVEIRDTEKRAHDLFLQNLVKGTVHLSLGQEAVAAGTAAAMQAGGVAGAVLGQKDVSVCLFGDGTTNIGAFHEALNFAVIWKPPVVFVCENNLYMEYTPISEVTAVAHPAADRAAAVGILAHGSA